MLGVAHVDALSVAGGRIAIGPDDSGRIGIAFRDRDGTVAAHLSVADGGAAELELRLVPGGPLVNVTALLRMMTGGKP